MSRRRSRTAGGDLCPVETWADRAPAYAALLAVWLPLVAVLALACAAGLWLLPARALIWAALPVALVALHFLFRPRR